MRLASPRCDERPNYILVAGVWSCSLARGHAGDHAFHAGHDLDAAAVFTWARTVAPYAPVAVCPEPDAQAIEAHDEYDLIPDATAQELRTLPTFAEMNLRHRRRRLESPVG
jgi:hypothetical protein